MRQTLRTELIEMKLGIDLREHIITARREGRDWRSIADELSERSGVPISYEGVRSWFTDEPELVGRTS